MTLKDFLITYGKDKKILLNTFIVKTYGYPYVNYYEIEKDYNKVLEGKVTYFEIRICKIDNKETLLVNVE